MNTPKNNNDFPIIILEDEKKYLREGLHLTDEKIIQNIEYVKTMITNALENENFWNRKYYPIIDHEYGNKGIAVENIVGDQLLIYLKRINGEYLKMPRLKLIINNILNDQKMFTIHCSLDYENGYTSIEGAFGVNSYIEVIIPKLRKILSFLVMKIIESNDRDQIYKILS